MLALTKHRIDDSKDQSECRRLFILVSFCFIDHILRIRKAYKSDTNFLAKLKVSSLAKNKAQGLSQDGDFIAQCRLEFIRHISKTCCVEQATYSTCS